MCAGHVWCRCDFGKQSSRGPFGASLAVVASLVLDNEPGCLACCGCRKLVPLLWKHRTHCQFVGVVLDVTEDITVLLAVSSSNLVAGCVFHSCGLPHLAVEPSAN